MGLLDYITAHSLDEDYAHVAEQRGMGPASAGGRLNLRLASVAALGVFGLLVATAAIQTARSEPVRESSREALVAQVQDQRAEMDKARADVLRLRRAVERAQSDVL